MILKPIQSIVLVLLGNISFWVFYFNFISYLATIPLVAGFFLTGNIIYNFAASSLDYKIYNLLGVMAMHIGMWSLKLFKKIRVILRRLLYVWKKKSSILVLKTEALYINCNNFKFEWNMYASIQ